MSKNPEKIKVRRISFGNGTTIGKVYEAKAAAAREGVNFHYRINNDQGRPMLVGVSPNKLKPGWVLVKEK